MSSPTGSCICLSVLLRQSSTGSVLLTVRQMGKIVSLNLNSIVVALAPPCSKVLTDVIKEDKEGESCEKLWPDRGKSLVGDDSHRDWDDDDDDWSETVPRCDKNQIHPRRRAGDISAEMRCDVMRTETSRQSCG